MERKKKFEKLVLGQETKEKMIVGSVEGKTVTDIGSDGNTATQSNDVFDKKSVPGSKVENREINVMDGCNPEKGVDGNAMEDPSGSSSSFGDTFSGDDGSLGLSDDGINSELMSWADMGYDFEELLRTRKKKLTNHWRNFIRPVMWRCKWAKLQMKNLQSQASIYSKMLEEFDQQRQSQLENFSAESQCSRSFPFPHHMKQKKIMQRKKRKRVEETTDISSYMQQHNLFGYIENKETSTYNAHIINRHANLAPAVRNSRTNPVDDDFLLQFVNEGTSLEQILAKIDSMQSIAHKMTSRADKVINENPGKFSCLHKLSVLAPSYFGASTAQDPTTPFVDKDKIIMTSQPVSEVCVEEQAITTNSVAADQVEEDTLPNNTESADQYVVANKTDNAGDEVPSMKCPIKDNLNVYERDMLSAKKHMMVSEKQRNTSSTGLAEAQNEKSDVFLASKNMFLLYNQKKREKRTGPRSGRKKSKSINPTFRA